MFLLTFRWLPKSKFVVCFVMKVPVLYTGMSVEREAGSNKVGSF